MTLDLTCAQCEATFQVDVQALLDDPKTLTCENCDAKASPRKAEALASAVDDLLTAMAELAPRFSISLAAETDDLPGETEAKEDDEEDGAPARKTAKADHEGDDAYADADDADDDEEEGEDDRESER